MEINDLKKKQIVTKDGHFMPLVFADLPATACAAAVMKLGNEVANQIKTDKFSQPKQICNRMFFLPIIGETIDMNELILSTNDITF